MSKFSLSIKHCVFTFTLLLVSMNLASCQVIEQAKIAILGEIEKINPPVSENLQYPNNWPATLRYPSTFVVKKAQSEMMFNNESIGFGSELQYTGEKSAAVDQLSIFLDEQGWKVIEKSDLSSNETLAIFKEASTGNQAIYTFKVDPKDPKIVMITGLVVIN